MAYSPDQKDVEGIEEITDKAPKVCPNCGKMCIRDRAKDAAVKDWKTKARTRDKSEERQ